MRTLPHDPALFAHDPDLFACYLRPDGGLASIMLYPTRRTALRAVLEYINADDEMILNESKVDAMTDDELADTLTDYAAQYDVAWYVENIGAQVEAVTR